MSLPDISDTCHNAAAPAAKVAAVISDTCRSAAVPAAKLAAVTRQMNKMEEVLSSEPPDEALIRSLYNEYLLKVEKLYAASDEGSHDEWLMSHKTQIDIFRDRVQKRLSSIRGDPATPSRTEGSHHSKRSTGSRSSSARVRLAERKAKVAAEKRLLETASNIEKREMRLKLELQELQLQKKKAQVESEELENELLEAELNNLDENDGSVRSSLSSVRHITTADCGKNAPIPNSSWLDILKKQGEISEKLSNQFDQATLPKQELKPFDGNITEYKMFKQKFERLIESKCSSDADKLCYLEQYTTGAVQKIVKSCVNSDSSVAFREAKSLLDREFANEYKVAASYLKILAEWPTIKNEDLMALQDLHSFLLKCNNYLEDSSPGNQINNPKEILNIVLKLPYKLREGWRRKTYKLQENCKPIQFYHLVEFVGREVSILKQPLFGLISDARESPKFADKSKRNFVTSAEGSDGNCNSNETCECCKKSNHSILYCKFFESKSFDEKTDFIKKSSLCFGCLSGGHISKFCRNRKICSKCNGRHPTIMHNEQITADLPRGSTEFDASEYGENDSGDHACGSVKADSVNGAGNKFRIICPIVPARVQCKNGKTEILVNVALDSHSSDCWMNANLAKKLGANPVKTTITLSTMENVKKKMSTFFLENIQISSIDGRKQTEIPIVYTKSESCWPFSERDIPSYSDITDFHFLADVPFDFVDADIDILVGMNVPGLVKCHATVDGDWNEPFASLHWLGWALNGPVKGKNALSHCKRTLSNSLELEQNLEKLFDRDFTDFSEADKVSIEDSVWLDKVTSSMKRLPRGNYQIDLPFHEDCDKFPSNRENVRGRFSTIKRRFDRDPEFFAQYQAFMKAMIDGDFVEEIPEADLLTASGKVWYLPHHAVFHKQKRKIRVVFDCSARFHGTSLNDKLIQGPDLTNNLVGVLLRFRCGEFAFVGDVEKMYYQVKVPKEQWDYMRFFWFNSIGEGAEFRLKVHVFGARSSPSIANFALKQTAVDHASENLEVRESIIYNFYVDDLLKSCISRRQALSLFGAIKAALAGGGFNLTGYYSNFDSMDSECHLDVPSNTEVIHVAKGESTPSKTLGLMWNTGNDCFTYENSSGSDAHTRRLLLRVISSIYDPLGMLAPIIILARRIFQETCRLHLSWDDPLPLSVSQAWKNWYDDLKNLSNIKIPRSIHHCLVEGVTDSVELHIFCDGSEIAYGAVAYARFVSSNKITVSSPIFVKTRLTPLNKSTVKTIPRIELCGAKVAVDVSRILQNELHMKFERRVFWTDSTTVLGYISNETKRFHRFVSNKVAYIRSHSSPDEWNHVSSDSNPADIASRGCTVQKLSSNELWNHGPKFLVSNVLPDQKRKFPVSNEDEEVKKEKIILSTKICSVNPFDELITSSSWYKIKVRAAWLMRYKCYLRTKTCCTGKLSVAEMKLAEASIIKYSQEKNFPNLKKSIFRGNVEEKSLRKLNLFIDDKDIIRVGGRLKGAAADYSFRYPILISSKSAIVEPLVWEAHRNSGHLGRETVSSVLRKRFWIVSGSSIIKKLIKSCVICRKHQARPTAQLMADLPEERVNADVAPFTNVGVDYFGPFTTVHGRKTEKRYGVIFTCLASRAVHIEVAHSLCTNSFINALRRFISRRGSVLKIYSDNGTNFVGGNKELKEALKSWNSGVVEDWLKQREVVWKFNTPCSSNYGGVWERLIRIIRKVFNSLLSEQRVKLSDDNLSTLMCEVELIVNSRPLTPVSDDPNDCEALTPNHLLRLNSQISYPPGLFHPSDNYCRRRWRQVQYLADVFWSRWRNEYLTLLQSRQKWLKEQSPLGEGDLVLVADNNLPRSQWSLGRIVEMLKSNDGRCRSAKVKIAKYKDHQVSRLGTVVIERPVIKLIKLLPC